MVFGKRAQIFSRKLELNDSTIAWYPIFDWVNAWIDWYVLQQENYHMTVIVACSLKKFSPPPFYRQGLHETWARAWKNEKLKRENDRWKR